MKRWLFGFACGVAFTVSIPLISPETGRAALKASRELGTAGPSGKSDRAVAISKPAPAREPELARTDPIKERFFPVDERPQAPISVPTIAIQPPKAAQPPATTTSTPASAPIAGPIPMPRKKPASLRTG
jgi:hypothetical protein